MNPLHLCRSRGRRRHRLARLRDVATGRRRGGLEVVVTMTIPNDRATFDALVERVTSTR